MLTPEKSIGFGLACVTITYAAYSHMLPNHADMRAAPAYDDNIDSARKKALWFAAGSTAALSLLTKDPMVFIIGGASVVAIDWFTRHSNATDPNTGQVASGTYTTPQDLTKSEYA